MGKFLKLKKPREKRRKKKLRWKLYCRDKMKMKPIMKGNKGISVKQVNCNKSKLCNIELCNILRKETSSILLLSEPYWYKKRIPGLPKGYVNLGVPCGRASIVAPIFMNLVLLPHISSSDFAVA